MRRKSSEAASPTEVAEQFASAGARAQAPPDSQASEFVGRAFRKYNDSLVRYLSVRLRSIRDAEEVAQEAYARMLKLEEPDTISHMQAYLFKIASNIAVDRMRQQGRRPRHSSIDEAGLELPAPAAAVDRIFEARQQLKLIEDIVAELPPKCRKAFLLYKFRNQSYRDIAAEMNLTESMIRKHVLRAISYCRARLDQEQEKAPG